MGIMSLQNSKTKGQIKSLVSKKMKNILCLIICIIGLASCKAQQIVDISTYNYLDADGKYYKDMSNHLNIFVGSWEYQEENEVFRVVLWKEEMVYHENGNRPSFWQDEIQGHFEMILVGQQAEPLETIIYTSDKLIGNSSTYYPPVLNAVSIDGLICEGTILDNSNPNPSNYYGVRCKFSMEIVPNTNNGQAIFNISSLSGEEYNIPNNVILTKVN